MKTMGDFLIDDDGELIFAGGDIAVGDATNAHTKDLLQTQPGGYRQHPTATAGVSDFLGDEDSSELIRISRRVLVEDGQTVNKMQSVNGEINIESWYE